MDRIRYCVYAHPLNCAPDEFCRMNVNIDYTPSKQWIGLHKEKVAYQTEYFLELMNAASLKIMDVQNKALQKQRALDIILAINLVLQGQIALSVRPLTPSSEPDAQLDPIPPVIDVEEKASGERLIRGQVSVRTDAVLVKEVTYGHTFVAEDNILHLLELIDKLNRHTPLLTGSLQTHNLAEALKSYESAMNQADLIQIYKSLFVALEKAVNLLHDHKSDDFDKEGASILGGSSDEKSRNKTSFKQLRDDYSRFKHIDRNATDTKIRLKAQVNLPQSIPTLRDFTSRIITARLNLL